MAFATAGLNQSNPLSFLKQVIPDTAAATNAETFKMQAALGLQENKQSAAMAKALQEIAGREKVSRLNNDIALGAGGTGLDAVLGQRRTLKDQNTAANTFSLINKGGGSLQHEEGAGVIDASQAGINKADLPGVSQANAAGKFVQKDGRQVQDKKFIGADGKPINTVTPVTTTRSSESTAEGKAATTTDAKEQVIRSFELKDGRTVQGYLREDGSIVTVE